MLKRIFIGIPFPKGLQQRFLEWQQEYKIPNDESQIRWITPKNLHITLVPPWEVEKLKVESEKLKVVESTPFDIKFSRIEFGPSAANPRMIWLSGGASPVVLDLRNKVYNALRQTPDGRPFKLHVTLARLRGLKLSHPPKEPSPSFGEGKMELAVEWQMPVEKFVLYESRLLPEGADYKILEEFNLK